jgi:hypothetical protein
VRALSIPKRKREHTREISSGIEPKKSISIFKNKRIVMLAGLANNFVNTIKGYFQALILFVQNQINFVSDRHIEPSLSHFCSLGQF